MVRRRPLPPPTGVAAGPRCLQPPDRRRRGPTRSGSAAGKLRGHRHGRLPARLTPEGRPLPDAAGLPAPRRLAPGRLGVRAGPLAAAWLSAVAVVLVRLP